MTDMNALVAHVKARRGAECISSFGACYRNKEKAAFMSDLDAWHLAGKPKSELNGLKKREQSLKDAGKW